MENYEQKKLEEFEKEILTILDKEGKAFKFDELVYDGLTLQYGDKTIGEILKEENVSQNPYFYSYLLALAMPNATLVKGYIKPKSLGVAVSHAWVEKDEFVYDVVFKRVFYKDLYEKYFNPDFGVICSPKVLKKTINQFSVGLQTIRNKPEMVDEFLAYKPFKKLKQSSVLKQLSFIQNEKVCEKIAERYNINTALDINN